MALTPEQIALAEQYSVIALNFAAEIYFGPVPVDKEGEINNGTVTLLELDGRQFGITNYHVLDRYRRRVADGEEIICQVGNIVIDLENIIVSSDEYMDLLVLDFSAVNQAEIRPNSEIPCQYHVPNVWPPNEVQEGEFILFGGFPGSRCLRQGIAVLEFGTVSSGGTEVHSVQEDVIACQLQLDMCEINFDREGEGLGALPGISGGPVMISRTTDNGVAIFDMVGIIFEYNENLDTLRARPISLITENGNITSNPMA